MNSHKNYDSNNNLKELLISLSSSETYDLTKDVINLGDRPEIISLLFYKLAEERKITNNILSELNQKYDFIISHINNEKKLDLVQLSGQDNEIINLIKEKNGVCAEDIKDYFNYKGLNAASQRLNKLFKEGYIRKNRIGQKVLYVV